MISELVYEDSTSSSLSFVSQLSYQAIQIIMVNRSKIKEEEEKSELEMGFLLFSFLIPHSGRVGLDWVGFWENYVQNKFQKGIDSQWNERLKERQKALR